MQDESTADISVLQIPADLWAASKQLSQPRTEQLHVEAFRTSWLTRLSELIVGKG